MANSGRHRAARGGVRLATERSVIVGSALIVVVAVVALVVVWRGRGPGSAVAPSHAPAHAEAAPATTPPGDHRRTIAEENALPGDPTWPVPDVPATWEKIRGFTDRVSALPGETVGLYVSTTAATFTVTVVRLGWYGGAGGRIVWTSTSQPGKHQPAAVVDAATGMRSAPWTKSLDLAIGADWVSGVYILKLVSDDGGQSMVPLTIRDDTGHSAILIGSGVTTWQAYNGWGGANLYTGEPGVDPKHRAKVVSFDRPYGGNGTGELFGREDALIRMVEAMGLDVSYTTDVDVHARPALLLDHRAYVVPTHDEYWSLEMRDGVEAARDHGVNLLFMGANASYRRIRLEDSPLGPNRREVNYRVAKDDPLNGKDDARVTTAWREQPSPRPESSLVGDYYECNPVDADMVITVPDAWVFAGTGFKAGDKIPHAVGNEYDRVTPAAPTPPGIEVLTHSPVTCKKLKSYSDMSWYAAPSGAGVLATGTFMWEPHLGPPCPDDAVVGVDCQVRKATANVLLAFAAGPAGAAHPPHPNLAALGITR